MFQTITFRDQNMQIGSNPIDIGMLLECMLFYETTNVVATPAILKQLLFDIGIDNLTELTEEGILKIIYTESFAGIKTENESNLEFHAPVIFSSLQHTFQDVIRKNCIELTGKEGKGRRAARRLEQHVEVIHHDDIVAQGAKEALLDQSYLKKAIPITIKRLLTLSEIPTDIEFQTEDTPKGIIVRSNIDYIKINQIYHQFVSPTHSSITPAFIFSNLFDVECDLYFSSNLLSEIATSPLRSDLILERLGYLVNRSQKSKGAISRFNEFVLNDTKTVREAINAKKVDINEMVEIIKKSRKFKDWLKKQSPTADLLKEYYKATTTDSFIDRLPGKTTRWFIFTGIGMAADAIATGGVGTAVGLTFSALDGFLLDKIIKGWKPSQFIEGDVKSLLKKAR